MKLIDEDYQESEKWMDGQWQLQDKFEDLLLRYSQAEILHALAEAIGAKFEDEDRTPPAQVAATLKGLALLERDADDSTPKIPTFRIVGRKGQPVRVTVPDKE